MARRAQSLLRTLGPGLITGVSDDDPSGIATYSQCGAQFGFQLLWTLLFSYPLMVAVQLMSARIGRSTGRGIAANLCRHFPRWLTFPLISLLVVANTINLGADLGAMGAALELLIGGPAHVYCAAFAVGSLLLQMFVPYSRYVHLLKWLTLSLFAYVGTVLAVRVPWSQVLVSTLVPSLRFDGPSFKMFIAVLGTTISPYLFFWQAAQEVEDLEADPKARPLKKLRPARARGELRRISQDTFVGMGFSNLVGLFIMLTTAVTLHRAGTTDIPSAAQAAEALRPLAGRFCFFLFAGGIIGTGLLAVPVLGGSAAYAISGACGWDSGLERKPGEAKAFYGILAASTLLGLAMNFLHFDPIRALIWTAVINGISAVPILVAMTLMASDRRIMGALVLPLGIRVGCWVTAVVMAGAAVGMVL